MAEDVGGIFYTVDAETGGLLRAERDVDRSSRRMEDSLDKVDKSTGNVSKGFFRMRPVAAGVRQEFSRISKRAAGVASGLTAATKVITAATAATAALAASVLYLNAQTMKNIDEEAKRARRLDTTIGAMRGVSLAASDAGIEQGALNSSIDSYVKRLGDAARGTGEAQKAYESLGLEASELAQVPLPEQLAIISDRISQIDSAAERSSIADRLMSGGRRMVNLFEGGGDAIRGTTEEVENLGLALNEVDVTQVEMANDALSRISLVVQAVRESVAVSLAPYLLTAAEHFNGMAQEAGGWGDAATAATESVLRGGANLLDWIFSMQEGIAKMRLAWASADSAVLDFANSSMDYLGVFFDAYTDGINLIIRGYNLLRSDGNKMAELVPVTERVAKASAEAGERVSEMGEELARLEGRERPSEVIGRVIADARDRAEEMANAAGEAGDSTEEFGSALEQAAAAAGVTAEELEKLRGAYNGLIDRLFPAEASLRKFREEQELLNLAFAEGKINADQLAESQSRLTGEQFADARKRFEDAKALVNESMKTMGEDEDEGSFLEKWLEGAEKSFSDFESLAANTADRFSESFGDAFESMIFDSESVGDAVRGMANNMLRAVVNSLGEMAAQWVAYHAVQMALGRTSEAAAIAGAAATGGAIAGAYAPAAAMASLASFGANAAPAIAGITSTVAVSKGLSLTGMAHDGIDEVPQEGTWLLDKGERVVGADLNRDLGQFLDRDRSGRGGNDRGMSGSANVSVNLIESTERAGQVSERPRGDGGRQEVDVFVADIMGDGPRSEAIRSKFGLQTRGR